MFITQKVPQGLKLTLVLRRLKTVGYDAGLNESNPLWAKLVSLGGSFFSEFASLEGRENYG